MNIDDIMKKIEVPDGPVIVTIFNLQKELMKEYDRIERLNGYIVPEPPYQLDDTKVQQRIKDFFWRTTEELAEAMEVRPPLSQLVHWTDLWNTKVNIRHFFEELSDALHFLVEASIIAGLDPQKEVDPIVSTLPIQGKSSKPIEGVDELLLAFSSVIYRMGLAANVFKNKPWKLTQMPTDATKFKNYLTRVWAAFIDLWSHLNCSQKQLYVLYAKKNLVNQWRQQTKY